MGAVPPNDAECKGRISRFPTRDEITRVKVLYLGIGEEENYFGSLHWFGLPHLPA